MSWWANKLQQNQPLGIKVQPAQAPVAPQPQPVQHGHPQQPVHPLQHDTPPEPQDLSKISYQEIARAHDGEKISKYWKGGEAMRKEGSLVCPECGTATSYTAYSGNTARIAGFPPRPHCFECGYNGLFTQADQANWA